MVNKIFLNRASEAKIMPTTWLDVKNIVTYDCLREYVGLRRFIEGEAN